MEAILFNAYERWTFKCYLSKIIFTERELDTTKNTMEAILHIVISFGAWSLLFILVCLIFPHRDYRWSYEIVGLLFALIAIILSAISAFIIGPGPLYSGK